MNIKENIISQLYHRIIFLVQMAVKENSKELQSGMLFELYNMMMVLI